MLDARQFVRDYPGTSTLLLILGGISAGKLIMDMYQDHQAKQAGMAGLALQTNPYAGVGALHMGALHTGAIDYGAINYGAIKKMGMIHY